MMGNHQVLLQRCYLAVAIALLLLAQCDSLTSTFHMAKRSFAYTGFCLQSTASSATLDRTDDDDLQEETVIVGEEYNKKRLDAFLSDEFPEQSRSYFGSLCQQGLVRVGGRAVKKSEKLRAGQEVSVAFLPTAEMAAEPEDIPLDILYEDEHLIAVAKPPGMVVHPAPGSWSGTFANALAFHMRSRGEDYRAAGGGDALRPGIVHRLDKGTSGVLLASKNSQCHAKLSEMFASRKIKKTYLAVCVGNPGQDVKIENLIARHPKNRQKMCVIHETQEGAARARTAVTLVDGLSFDSQLSLARVQIETGRTHQIRVHLAHRRTPVLGDELYGNGDQNRRAVKRFGLQRPLLHAYQLELDHPITGEPLSLKAPVPEDMVRVLAKIYPQVEDEQPDMLLAVNLEESVQSKIRQ